MEDTSHSDLRALAHGKPEPMPNSRAASPLAIDRDAAVSDHQPPATAGTLGRHLARRLVQAGVSDVFVVPGDSNLVLLDHLAAEPGLSLVRCCNELNAGHAADGYARARGVGACAVAFTVGGLSLLNAVAGANSDDLPVICIVGGPNSNDYGASNRVLHHTIGLPDFSHELRCFQPVTCYQVVVNNLDDAHEQIDTAISTALRESKPVYISVSCNLAGIPHPTFSPEPAPMIIPPRLSCRMNLEHAVHAAAEFLNRAVKPVMVAGPKIRVARAAKAFARLADASSYPVAIMPSAKGLVAEHHPRFIGTYWGVISTAFCAETVESADAYLLAGPVLSDFTTVGYSLALRKERAVVAQPDRVVVGDGPAFGGVLMADFLGALAERLERNTTAHDNHRRIFVPDGELPARGKPDEPLRVNVLFRRIQAMLSGESAVFSDAGDSWFNCQKLKLPPGCAYESQQQYGSAGWSVGAALGYAQAAKDRRVVACIGDGNFQMTAQEVSTMLRCAHRSVVFVVNNGGYTNTTEAATVQGGAPYNTIKDWDYAGLVDAIDNGGGSCCWTAKVRTEEELEEAIETAMGERRGCLCFVEVVVHRGGPSG